MFSTKQNVKTTLLCGPKELSKTFMFEAAIYWAEEGRRVVYITPAPLESLPAACHDRSNPAPAAFKLMRFMYLENYETFMDRLIELHTFATLPSVLLIDDLDTYTMAEEAMESSREHRIAKTCSMILDTMNCCSRILKLNVYICAWSSSSWMNHIGTYMIYFTNIWNVTDEGQCNTILLQKYSHRGPTEKYPSYRYRKLEDGTRVLKQIFYEELPHD